MIRCCATTRRLQALARSGSSCSRPSRRPPRCSCLRSTPTSSIRASSGRQRVTSGTPGAIMLGVTAVQAAFPIAAVYCASRVAMGFGRDVREALFHRVTDFSAREVNLFGAPSLITRITNDVQQVQMLVVMTCTMVVAAPITVVFGVFMAMRQDLGMSWLLGVSLPLLVIILGVIVSRRWCRSSGSCRSGSTTSTACCAGRSSACASCARSCASPSETAALPRGQRRAHEHLADGRPAAGADVPHDDARRERVERRCDLDRWPPHRQRQLRPSARWWPSSRISR